MTVEPYWMFFGLCVILSLLLIRMVVLEQVTLQASLSFLVLLLLGAAIAVFPNGIAWVARVMGFELPANFFFSMLIAALVFLHLASLVHLSRVKLRTVTLTQELALLQEKVDRALRAADENRSRAA
jgi:hypothetical protein